MTLKSKIEQNVHDSRLSKIESLREQGHTLEEIANEFGITRERVRQLLLKSDKNIDQRMIKAEKARKRLQEIYDYAVTNWDKAQSLTLEEFAIQVDSDVSTIKEALSPFQLAFLIANDENVYIQKYTDQDCIDAIRLAQTFTFPLSNKSYAKLVNSGDVLGPSVPLILKRFGSWTEACRIAGVESGETVRPTYDQVFTDTQLLTAVRRFMYEQPDANWSIQRYEIWRENMAPESPSSGLLRNRLGNWAFIRVQALRLETSEYNMYKFAKAKFND